MLAPLDAAIAKQQPLLPKLNRRRTAATSTVAPYFVAYVEEQLVNRYGATTTYGGGLRVYTTLDLREQTLAERTARHDIRSTGLSTAIVSIDPSTSYVKAMVGGWDYKKSQFNIATQGHRQPGSSFKPFVFLAALKKGIRPATRFNSHKVVLPNGTTQGWYVKNDTPVYEGWKPLDYALAKSDNTIFAQLTEAVGPQPVADAAHAAGINSPLNPNLSIGLGGLTLGVTPLEMAHAYATIANEGERVGGSILFHTPDAGIRQSDAEPISILRVVHPGGHADENTPLPRQVISRNDALTLVDAMRGVVRFGTGTKAQLPRRTVIGKTGTTSNFLDAWFIGAVPQRVTAVWVGYPDVARPMLTQYHGHEVLGGTYPAQVWHDFMAAVTQHMPVRDWPHADFVADQSVIVDRATGKRAPAGCTNTMELIIADDKLPDGESSCRATPFTVPDLSGLGEKQAAKQVFDNGLVFVPDLQPAQPGQHAGSVIDQTPDAYTRVGNKTPVHVTIAVAAPQVYVPAASSRKTRRISIAEAIGRLRTAHFRIALIGNTDRTDLPDGTVVHQDPAPDTLAPQGSVVTLEVVGNVDAVVVPDVSGMKVADAERALRADGLSVASARRAVGGRALPADWVITTNWTPGVAVPPGTSINLVTSRRPL
jgi:membrane carboxypeptidase/penicillin-binding protein